MIASIQPLSLEIAVLVLGLLLLMFEAFIEQIDKRTLAMAAIAALAVMATRWPRARRTLLLPGFVAITGRRFTALSAGVDTAGPMPRISSRVSLPI